MGGRRDLWARPTRPWALVTDEVGVRMAAAFRAEIHEISARCQPT